MRRVRISSTSAYICEMGRLTSYLYTAPVGGLGCQGDEDTEEERRTKKNQQLRMECWGPKSSSGQHTWDAGEKRHRPALERDEQCVKHVCTH